MRTRELMIGLACLGAVVGLNLGGCNGIVDKQAAMRLQESIGDTSIAVFPAFVREGEQNTYSAAAAEAIGEFLTQENVATVTVCEAEVPITSQWGMNQARMFQDSAADFSDYVRQNPTETDYALLPEYLIGGRGKPVGVHVYLVDAEGTVAYALLFNSHHEEFNDVDPQTIDDCTTILINRFRTDLAEHHVKCANTAKRIRPDSSLTVFPVWLPGGPAKNVGEGLGLVLEQQVGMSDIHPTELVFNRPADVDFVDAAKRFGEFARDNAEAIGTDYALYAEILGTRNPPRVEEVCAVVVDKAGACVWIDRQTREDPDFKRVGARNPMTCCVLVSERLRDQLDTTVPVEPPGDEGRMAKLWAAKSGLPEQAERDAMEQRVQTLKEAHQSAKLLVYPVQLMGELDAESATHLASLLNEREMFRADAAEAQPQFEITPSSNEQRRLWDLARAFRDYVAAEPPDADYVLFAEYLIRPSDQKVWTVHFVVCDRAGQWVIVDFQNEYQPDFKRVDPKNREDCGLLVAERLASYVR